MKVAVFSSKPYDRQFLDAANRGRHELRYVDCGLTAATTAFAKNASAVCLFANDQANAGIIKALALAGVQLIALRSAGFDNVDLEAARAHDIAVARVPAYSPNAVAEHAFALLLSLNRKVHLAYERVRHGNFALDGLMGFDLAGKTFGIIGTGNIGSSRGADRTRLRLQRACGSIQFAARTAEASSNMSSSDELLKRSDIVSLHCPLNEATRHLIGSREIGLMKPAAVLINTSRGSVIDTPAVIEALEARSPRWPGDRRL